jgi:peptide/nickel transport system substrate-binding protein
MRKVCVVLALLLAGCQAGAVGGATRHGALAHVMRIGYVNDPSSLNPLFAYAQTQIDLADLYCETLVGLNPRNQLIPLLASRVPALANGDISRDGLTITYHLRPNARFADGVPVTASDVIFTYRAILDPRNPVTWPGPYRRIASIVALDPHTVRIRLKQRWAAATGELFAQSDFAYGILPAHAFANNPDNVARGDWNEHPFGSGPFRVVRWDRATQIVLAPNPYAWRKPHLRSLIVKIYPDDTSRFVALRTGEIDVAQTSAEQTVEARSMPGLRVVLTPMNGEYFLSFQTRHAIVNDPRVRHAIAEAVNRARILRDALYGLNPADTTEDPSMLWSFDPRIPAIAYDPKDAARQLDAAGWRLSSSGVRSKDGKPLSIDVAFMGTLASWRRIATLLQADLRAVGIDAELHGYTVPVFQGGGQTDVLHSGRFDIALTGFDNGSDPEQSEVFSCDQRSPGGSDSARYCDPEYDRAYAAQQRTLDRQARRAAFFRMQHILHDSYALDFIFTDAYHDVISTRVRGWAPNMLYRYSNAQDWDTN